LVVRITVVRHYFFGPRAIKPLQIGEEIVYEMNLTNQGDTSTFALDVDPPVNWSYTLSSDTVILNQGESATFLLTVISPADISVEDYIIHVEAISLEDSQMTAGLDLVASSKAELITESATADCEGEEVVLDTKISNIGLADAEDVKRLSQN
jgi:uncharacterized membrane protein